MRKLVSTKTLSTMANLTTPVQITAQELRIGNWLKTKLNDTGFVSIDHNHIVHIATQNYFQYEPIPLTPEILEKAGFTKVESETEISWMKTIYDVDIRGKIATTAIVSFVEGLGVGLIVHQQFLGTAESNVSYPLHHLQYLHQLQNLIFALTGTELVINL